MTDTPHTRPNARRPAAALAGAALLGACASGMGDRMKQAELSPIENPVDVVGERQITMPLPAPDAQHYNQNSLWRTGARSFFDDQRADEVGDILTVNIAIADKAQVNNSTARTRTGSTDASVTALLGLDSKVADILPGAATLNPAVGFNSALATNGAGTVNRAETINLTVAAVITQKLPNGNLVIGGSQEVKVNNEVRELLVSGIIRPQDITADNTVDHTQIAQARISYGGRGDISNLQGAKYGQRAYEAVAPF